MKIYDYHGWNPNYLKHLIYITRWQLDVCPVLAPTILKDDLIENFFEERDLSHESILAMADIIKEKFDEKEETIEELCRMLSHILEAFRLSAARRDEDLC